MFKAVVHADAIAGLLVAAALVRPERLAGMKVSPVKRKLKEKAFAPGVDRDEVYQAEATLRLPLDEFIAVAITGIQQVAPTSGYGRIPHRYLPQVRAGAAAPETGSRTRPFGKRRKLPSVLSR
jgi:hypothetical protein